MKQYQPTGVITAIITPFKSDLSIDFEAFEKLIEFQIKNKVDGIVVCGSTGEGATLSIKEKVALFVKAVEIAKGRVPIIAGTGSNDTQATIELSILAKESGVDALLLVAPYYNKPSQLGLLNHFMAISESVAIPQIIYNVPGRTGVNIQPETQIEIAKKCKNVVATKEASGDLMQIMKIIKNAPKDFSVLCGDDALTLPAMLLGAKGVISVFSNFAPKQLKSITDLAAQGLFARAKDLHYKFLDLMNLCFIETNPVPVKAILQEMGLIQAFVRMPLVPIDAKNLEIIRNELKKLKFIK